MEGRGGGEVVGFACWGEYGTLREGRASWVCIPCRGRMQARMGTEGSDGALSA